MAEKSISVRLSARVEQYIAAMKAAEASTTGLSRSGIRAINQLGGSLQNMGRSMTRYVTVPVVALGAGSVFMAQKFDTAFAQMVGLANVPASEVDNLKESVLALAGETARAPQELADGLYLAASSGLDSAAAMDVVTIAARSAAAGMGSTDDIVKLLTGAIGSYGSANITAAEAADVLSAAIRDGRAEPEEMAQTMGRILPVAAQMGVSFGQVGGALAFLTNTGIETDQAVTGLRAGLINLYTPGKQARDTLESMGTSADELRAAIRENGLMGALDLLREHGFNGNVVALRKLLPEVRGLNAIMPLLADETGTLGGIMDDTTNSAGSLDFAFAAVSDTAGFKMAQAFSDVKAAMIRMGDILLPLAATVATAISDLVNWFAKLPKPIQDAALVLGTLAAAGGPVLIMAGSLLKNWQLVTTALSKSNVSIGSAAKTLGVLGAGVAAGLYIWDQFQVSQRNVKARTDEVSTALGQATTDAWNYAEAAAGATGAVDPLTVAQMALSNALTGNTEGGMALTQALGALGLQTEDAWTVTDGLYTAMNQGTPEDYAKFWMDLGGQIGLTGDQLTLFAGVMGNTMPMTHDQLEAAASAAGFADGEFDTLTGHAHDLADAIGMVGDVPSLAATFLNDSAAGSELGGNLVKLAQGMADAAGNGDDTVAVYENFLSLLPSLSEEQQNVVLGLADTTDALGATGDAIEGLEPLWTSLWSDKGYGTAVDGLESVKETADRAGDSVNTLAEAQAALAAISASGAQHNAVDWVGYAESISGASAAGEDALVVYQTLLEAVSRLTPDIRAQVAAQLGLSSALDLGKGSVDGLAQAFVKAGIPVKGFGVAVDGLEGAKAANGIRNIGDAASGATSNLADLIVEMFSASHAQDAAATAASTLTDILTRMITPGDDLRQSTRDLTDGFSGMNDILENGHVAFDETTNDWSLLTEDGAKMQEQTEATRDAIFAHGEALLENGMSAEAAAADITANVRALNDQWRAAGYTEDQIALLNAQYGLTPEQITTMILLLGDKTAKGQIGAYISNLKTIPTAVSTQVNAYPTGVEYVKSQINTLTYGKSVPITPYLTTSDLWVTVHTKTSNSVQIHSAEGRFVPGGSNMLSTLGEVSGSRGDEVVLPLGDKARMSQLLGMDGVGSRVAAAMSGWAPMHGWTGGGASSDGGGSVMNVTVNMPPGSNGDDVVRALRKYQRRSGPVPISVR